MKIFKYQVPLPGVDLQLPIGSKILSLQVQGNMPMLWILIDDTVANENRQTRRFTFVGTGHEVDKELLEGQYIGTVQQDGFVWHLFEDLIS